MFLAEPSPIGRTGPNWTGPARSDPALGASLCGGSSLVEDPATLRVMRFMNSDGAFRKPGASDALPRATPNGENGADDRIQEEIHKEIIENL